MAPEQTETPSLIDRTIAELTTRLELVLSELASAGSAALRQTIAREREGEPLDQLAEACVSVVPRLLEQDTPNVFAAYFALEVAAAREPDIFGPSYRLVRDYVMRAMLGAARREGIEVQAELLARRREWSAPGWRASIVGSRLLIELPDGARLVLGSECEPSKE